VSTTESLLAGLIDYAGLYPPASLDMRSAVGSYLAYRSGEHAYALGRFIVDVNRVDELRATAQENVGDLKLSLIVPPDLSGSHLASLLKEGVRIEAVETKVSDLKGLDEIKKIIPSGLETYVELPIDAVNEEMLKAIAGSGARAKLRMGGVVAQAFPPTKPVVMMLTALAERRIPFKATAGLHHPIRSVHHFTYEPGSSFGIMHGFLNLAFAAALLYFGGAGGEALHVLEEKDSNAWRVAQNGIRCRGFAWNADQLAEMRKEFFISFGSCSFEEPIRDLEALGWL
jgi:hypothetical protein